MRIHLDFDLNSGAYAVLYTIGFFGVLLLTKYSPFVGQNVIGIEGAWTVGFGAALAKRHGNNKIELEAQKLDCADKTAK